MTVAVSDGQSGPPISLGCATTITACSPPSKNCKSPLAKPCSYRSRSVCMTSSRPWQSHSPGSVACHSTFRSRISSIVSKSPLRQASKPSRAISLGLLFTSPGYARTSLAAGLLSAASSLQHCADQMELERARALLRRERVRIEQALARVSVPGREELAGQDEMADAASQLYEEEFDEGQVDDLRAELAEARLLDGTYGRSIESGEDIPDERLEAVPTAERTAEEQARFERG